MARPRKKDLEARALAAVRDYGIHLTQFRNAMSAWAGLNATDMECLRLLFMKQVATPSDLARHTGLTSGAVTSLLDRLERAGLVTRRPNPNDRRGSLVSPSPSAQKRVASWFSSARAAQAELIATYSAIELETVADVFERFTALWMSEKAKLEQKE